MLVIENIKVGYSALPVLNGVSIRVDAGQFAAVVGPNGAGKTTLFKSISGTLKLRSGRISFEGVDLATVPAHRRPHLGIAHVPEGRQVFPSLTVMENLEMGAYTRKGQERWSETLPMVLELFPILSERRDQLAGTLSGGEQQMLAIGRGLASAPELLMLDEPSMGLAPTIVDAIFERIHQIHTQHGVTILLVEQRVAEALETCDRGYVLETGRVAMEGTHNTLMSDERVRRAYLGM